MYKTVRNILLKTKSRIRQFRRQKLMLKQIFSYSHHDLLSTDLSVCVQLQSFLDFLFYWPGIFCIEINIFCSQVFRDDTDYVLEILSGLCTCIPKILTSEFTV